MATRWPSTTTNLGGNSKSVDATSYLYADKDIVDSGFNMFQPAIQENTLQQQAVDEQMGLRGRMRSLMGDYGKGTRLAINNQFDTESNNVSGQMMNRGLAGSSLNVVGQLGVEGQRQGALGDLDSQILDRGMGNQTQSSDQVSKLLFGSSEQSTNLFGSVLGSGGLGRFGKSMKTASKQGDF